MATIELDGTTLEGGGQLLRVALSLASLTGKAIHVTHIRGKRGPPSAGGTGKDGGLKPAHLAAAEWLATATAATTKGMEVRSTDLFFQPTRRVDAENDLIGWSNVYEDGQLIRRESYISMPTNGSILLILQAIFPVVIKLPSSVPLHLTIEGGTNVSKSPSIEYISQVFLPLISAQLKIPPIGVTIQRRGWNVGQNVRGIVTFHIVPMPQGSVQPALRLIHRGTVEKVHISVIAPNDGSREQIKAETLDQLGQALPDAEYVWAVDEDSGNVQRIYFLLVVETSSGIRLGRDCLVNRKVPKGRSNKIERKAREDIQRLVSEVVEAIQRELSLEGCVDEFMEDQLVIFKALAHERSEVNAGEGREASLHTRTAQWVAERILGVAFS